MIAFDNGPKHGDYARYIDDLMRVAAAATASTTAGTIASTMEATKTATMQSAMQSASSTERESMRRLRERVAERASAQADGPRFLPSAAMPGSVPPTSARPVVSGSRDDRAGDTGFVDATPASNAAARAAAIASALMSGEIARRTSGERDTLVSIAAILVGILLIIVGVAWPAASLAVVLAGGAALAWGGRRLRDAARSRSLASPGSTGR